MANIDDFRGPGEVGSGTAFETGFAVALGKDVWGYATNEGTLPSRTTGAVNVSGQSVHLALSAAAASAQAHLVAALNAGDYDAAAAAENRSLAGSGVHPAGR
jgi:nucleoside 2-deoxyribosyltransferase